jgi:phosphoribosyl 1,2-cyclic phosphodiesterase
MPVFFSFILNNLSDYNMHSGEIMSDDKKNNKNMEIIYWGTRGSIPSPISKDEIKEKEIELIKKIIADGGTQKLFSVSDNVDKIIEEYVKNLPLSISGTYGGDSTCIEVRAKNSPLIVIDAGSGARKLGNDILNRIFAKQNMNPLSTDEKTKRDLHLFFSHYHWDHIQGFPFFAPAFLNGDNTLNVNFYGKMNAKSRLSHVLLGQQQYPNFPVEWNAMPCSKKYTELGRMSPVGIKLGDSKVEYAELDHPDRVFGYAINSNGKKFVCATDTEHRDVEDPVLVKLAKDADILYYDAQYTPEEYSGKKGMPKVRWGHSTFEWGIKTALLANAKSVVFGHHDPARNDKGIEEMLKRAIMYRNEELKKSQNEGKKLDVIMGYDGLKQVL